MKKNFQNVKIILFFISINLSFSGCTCYKTYGIDEGLISYAKNILKQPKQISHLNDIKDEYYNDSCFFKQLNDSIYCNKLIDFITSSFNKDKGCNRIILDAVFVNDTSLYKMVESDHSRERQKYALQKIKSQTNLKDFSLSDFIEFSLVKSKYGVSFLFYKNIYLNKTFLCNIHIVVFPYN